MDTNYIALAIPFFFLMIGAELLILRYQGKSAYRFNDAVTALSCGVGQQVSGIFIKALLVAVYIFLSRFAFFQLPEKNLMTWIFTFIAVDFAYYWWHRASHRVNILWAAHVVHHQSQDFNLAVALRQAWFTGITSFLFYLPLVLLGVPIVVFGTVLAFNTLYQFWIHTETIGRLGFLEKFMNSPSHHRVHHAINPRYIDKNYAASFIVWDRLFGTFSEEGEPCVYGTVKPLPSWNGLWANLEYFAYMISEVRGADLSDKIRVWFMPPEWRAKGLDCHVIPPVQKENFKKFETQTGKGIQVYIAVNFVLAVMGTTYLLFHENVLPMGVIVEGAALIFATIWGWAGLLESKRWAWPFEVLRGVALLIFFISIVPT